MIKKIICLICVLSLVCSLTLVNASAITKQVEVYLDGVKIEFDVQPQIINGNTMVPLRAIAEKLGATVKWDEKKQSASIVKEDEIIILQIQNKNMIINNETVILDSPPIIINNRIFVPIRTIANGLHVDVNWDKINNAVLLNTVNNNGITSNKFTDYQNVLDDYQNGKYGEELFYLNGKSQGWGNDSAILIYTKDNVSYIIYYQPIGRYKTRQLSKDEYEEFCAFINDNSIDNLKDYSANASDGTSYNYYHCTKNTTKNLYIYCPENNIYEELIKEFFKITDTGDFAVHYTGTLANAKVLIKNEDANVASVWKDGDDFRVCINKDDTLTWHAFSNGKIGEAVDEPKKVTIKDTSGDDFQKSKTANEYYIVKNQHIIGKVNMDTNFFTPIVEIDDDVIFFNSTDIWVDEANEKVYIVVNNDLLELPINLN